MKYKQTGLKRPLIQINYQDYSHEHYLYKEMAKNPHPWYIDGELVMNYSSFRTPNSEIKEEKELTEKQLISNFKKEIKKIQ